MTKSPRIAIDAMGGDEGVRVMIAGAALARHRHESFRFLLVGDEVQIKAALDLQITTLRLDVKSAESKLSELKLAGVERWKEFEGGVGAATARLRKSIESVAG